MFSLFKPNDQKIRDYLAACESRDLNYSERGQTAGDAPKGYKIDIHEQALGQGLDCFMRACEAVRLFKMNDFGWIKVCWPTGSLKEDQIFATVARIMGIWTVNPCRIVYLINEDSPELKRYGFAFGTIESHAEQGEERFQVEWRKSDNQVTYHIYAFSRAHHILARLGYPVSLAVQKRFFRDSKESMRRFVQENPTNND